MNSRVIFGGMIVAIISVSSVIAVPIAKATPLEPDWMGGEPIVTKSANEYSPQRCVDKLRKVKTNPLAYYQPDEANSKWRCVYQYSDFEITFYTRYSSNILYDSIDLLQLHGKIERGMAVSFDGGDFVPVRGFEYDFMNRLLYTRDSKDLWYETGYEIIHTDVIHHLKFDEATASYSPIWGDSRTSPITFQNGTSMKPTGVGVSENGKWISFVVNDTGMFRIEVSSAKVDYVASGFQFHTPYYYSPVNITAVTNDGRFIFQLGAAHFEFVKVQEGCSRPVPDAAYIDYSRAPYINCSSNFAPGLSASLAQLQFGSRVVQKLRFSDDDSRIELQGISFWFDVYPHNSQFDSLIDYLALGDSYSSGEGDIDASGASHYLQGTNVFGNYKDGIPRELCHVSDRAYPFLLAKDMGLVRGNKMQSIACSGAVRNDVLSLGVTNLVDPAYMGQLAQKTDYSIEGRLEGIADYQRLKADAVSRFIPGRIQQLEHVRTYRPKVATITISGNDLGFGDIILSCMKTVISDCYYTSPEGRRSLGSLIKSSYGKQVEFYKALKRASPGTDFYAVGYPQFINRDTFFCWDVDNALNQSEREMTVQAVSYVNQVLQSAAAEAGIKFINIESALSENGGDMCAGSGLVTDPHDRFVAGSLTKLLGTYEDGATETAATPIQDYVLKNMRRTYRESKEGTYMNPVTALMLYMQPTFHPNAAGHQAIYQYIHNHQKGTSLQDATCDGGVIICPSTEAAKEPLAPGYFMLPSEVLVTDYQNMIRQNDGSRMILQAEGISVVERGQNVRVQVDAKGYASSSDITIIVHSTPQLLATVQRTSNEKILVDATIPTHLSLGYHTITVDGVGVAGGHMRTIQTLFVTGSIGDIDGDGIGDAADTCEFLTPSGIDDDNDKIDDNCDLDVGMASEPANSALGGSMPPSGVVQGQVAQRVQNTLLAGTVSDLPQNQLAFGGTSSDSGVKLHLSDTDTGSMGADLTDSVTDSQAGSEYYVILAGVSITVLYAYWLIRKK